MSTRALTQMWRAEAILRLFQNIVIGNRDSGGQVRDCWVPTDACDAANGQILAGKNAYSSIRVGGHSFGAHAVVLMLVLNRFLRRKEQAMHLCNNPVCRNPTHIVSGNAAKNMTFARECGRLATGSKNGHATCPEQTPRGCNHYRSRLRGEQRKIALELLKKYHCSRGCAGAIADYMNVSRHTIYNLARTKDHLATEVRVSEITLPIRRWVPRKEQRCNKPDRASLEAIVRTIRQRFHNTPEHARAAAITSMANEYGYCAAWVRKIVRCSVYADMTPDIPRPTGFGINTRVHQGKSFQTTSK